MHLVCDPRKFAAHYDEDAAESAARPAFTSLITDEAFERANPLSAGARVRAGPDAAQQRMELGVAVACAEPALAPQACLRWLVRWDETGAETQEQYGQGKHQVLPVHASPVPGAQVAAHVHRVELNSTTRAFAADLAALFDRPVIFRGTSADRWQGSDDAPLALSLPPFFF